MGEAALKGEDEEEEDWRKNRIHPGPGGRCVSSGTRLAGTRQSAGGKPIITGFAITRYN